MFNEFRTKIIKNNGKEFAIHKEMENGEYNLFYNDIVFKNICEVAIIFKSHLSHSKFAENILFWWMILSQVQKNFLNYHTL